jgi:hypothetical protein
MSQHSIRARLWANGRVRTAALVMGASALASSLTYVVAAGAVGIPDGPENPALVYSGVLLRDGIPVTDQIEVEVGIWDDVVRGEPDELLCTTGENVLIKPDASGNFSIALPTLFGEEDKDCLAAIAAENNIYVQVEIDKQVVSYTINDKEFQRLPVAAVPFAVDAKRAQFAAGDPTEALTIEQRLSALEAALAAGEGEGEGE